MLECVFDNPCYFYIQIYQSEFSRGKGIEWPLKLKIFDADKDNGKGELPLNTTDIELYISTRVLKHDKGG